MVKNLGTRIYGRRKLKFESKLEQKQGKKWKPIGIEIMIKHALNEENKLIDRRFDLAHGKVNVISLPRKQKRTLNKFYNIFVQVHKRTFLYK